MSAPGMPFNNPIVGGGNLIIPFIQSPNYVPLVSGWRISRNGDAEFASGTFRGPLVIVDPNTGLVVASISSTGNIAGQYASIENDVIVAGQSVADLFGYGRGLVGFFGTTAAVPAPGNSGVFSDTAWFSAPLEGDRIYLIACTPLRVNRNSGSFSRTVTMRIHAVDDLGNPAFNTAVNPIGMPTGTIDSHVITSLIFAISTNPLDRATFTFQFQCTQSGSGEYALDASGGWNMYCLDMGNFSNALAVLNGGVGTATTSVSHQRVYPATLSQSYNGSGNQIVSTDLWRSDFGDGNGETTSLCIFDGAAIRADTAGATITSATLTMFCTTAEESNGSLAFDPDPATSIPATQASFQGGTYPFSDDWPNPGWFTFDITTDFLVDILAPNNNNAMKISSSLFGLAATRFAGASVANRPYITVNYTT